MKILIHIDQSERWGAVTSNLKNMTDAKKNIRPDLEIEVVVTGEAIRDLVDSLSDEKLYQQLKEATQAGFKIMGCNNSLNHFKIAPDDVFSFVEIVPAGLLEIAAKQEEGFAYVKP